MNLSIETLVTVMVAVLVAGIVGISVFGESTKFIDWSDETSGDANCDLMETQFGNSVTCTGGSADEYDSEIQDDYDENCDGSLDPNDYCS